MLFGHHYTVRPLSDGVYMSEVEDLTLKTARWPTSELLQMEQPLRLSDFMFVPQWSGLRSEQQQLLYRDVE